MAELEAHGVTAGEIADFLRPTDPHTGRRYDRALPAVLEVLIVHEGLAYVRWPTGSLIWRSASALRDRGFDVPELGILQRDE